MKNTQDLITEKGNELADYFALVTTTKQKEMIRKTFEDICSELPQTAESKALEVVKMIHSQAQDNNKMATGLFGQAVLENCSEIMREIESK